TEQAIDEPGRRTALGVSLQHPLQIGGMPDVISVQRGDDLTAGKSDTHISRDADAAISDRYDAQAGQPIHVGARDLHGEVGRAIVDHDDFFGNMRLRRNTVERAGERAFSIISWNNDADRRQRAGDQRLPSGSRKSPPRPATARLRMNTTDDDRLTE